MEKSQGRGNAKWVLGFMPLLSLLFICLLQEVEGVQHQVGGTPGWSLPSFNNVNYTAWASTQTFSIGDTLYFNYSSQYHNVLEVTEVKYDKCDNSSPIAKWADGATLITLNQTGSWYYICGIPGHCSAGQKVSVLVGHSNSTASTAPTPTALSPLFALLSVLLFPLLSPL